MNHLVIECNIKTDASEKLNFGIGVDLDITPMDDIAWQLITSQLREQFESLTALHS